MAILLGACHCFEEQLELYPLGPEHLVTIFKFNQELTLDRSKSILDYGAFPASVDELLENANAEEVRISFTRGRWNYPDWGSPPSYIRPSTIGIEVEARFRSP